MTIELNRTAEPLKGVRRSIARRMTAAWDVPVFHATVTVDVGQAELYRRSVAGASLNDAIVLSVARVLRGHPQLNAHFIDEGVALQPAVNIGVAVAAPAGLIVPVIHNADEMRIEALVERRADLVARARDGALEASDVAAGTFTVSNLGMFGIDRFDAILNIPQVAILAVGGARPEIHLSAGGLAERQVADLTLTVDHRAVDGAGAAAFLRDLRVQLEAICDASSPGQMAASALPLPTHRDGRED